MSLDFSNIALRQAAAALEGRRDNLNSQIVEVDQRRKTLIQELEKTAVSIGSLREGIALLATVTNDDRIATPTKKASK